MNMARVRYLPVRYKKMLHLSEYPNFSATGSIAGMKERYYGKDALLVRSGKYIYNVSSNPSIYWDYAY